MSLRRSKVFKGSSESAPILNEPQILQLISFEFDRLTTYVYTIIGPGPFCCPTEILYLFR
ncbi:hypothetical protein HDF11_004750 [Tunturiibacter psychrotolerans]